MRVRGEKMIQHRRFISLITFALASFVSSACVFAQSRLIASTFQGMRVGNATVSTATQRFGKPTDTFQDGRGYTWLYYRDIGPVPGKVEMYANSQTEVIETVVLYPETPLSIADAEKRFGPSFKLVRYDYDNCLDNGGEGPIYESLNGPIEFFVSSTLGIALYPDRGQVRYIQYLSKPLGSEASRCNNAPGGSLIRKVNPVDVLSPR